MRQEALPAIANVRYVLRDAKGRIKPIWQEFQALYALRKLFGLSLPKIPFLTGYWSGFAQYHNLTTTVGKALVADLLGGVNGSAYAKSIGVGTGTTAAAITDTALETEKKADGTAASGVHALPDASVTNSLVTTDTTNDTLQMVGTIAFTATLAITESGVFNADTNGTMLARQVFSAVNVVSGDSLEITWKFDID